MTPQPTVSLLSMLIPLLGLLFGIQNVVVIVDAKECYEVCTDVNCPSVADQKALNGNNEANCVNTPSKTHLGYCHMPHFSCLDFSASAPQVAGSGDPWTRFPYESYQYEMFSADIPFECWGACACNVAGYACTACGYCSGCTGNCDQTPCPVGKACKDPDRRQLGGEDKNDSTPVMDFTRNYEAEVDYYTYAALSDQEKQDRLVGLHCRIGHVTRDDKKFVQAIEDIIDTNNDGVVSLDEFKRSFYDIQHLVLEHCVSATDRIKELEATCSSSSNNNPSKKMKSKK